jgi:hypothetical protein
MFQLRNPMLYTFPPYVALNVEPKDIHLPNLCGSKYKTQSYTPAQIMWLYT